MPQPLITFDGVHKVFNETKDRVHAVNDVSLTINAGEIFGIIGYSGAGKSTLVRLINGLEPATGGTITVDGNEISGMTEKQMRPVRAEIGMVFQQFNLFNSKSVANNIAYPLRLASWKKPDIDARVTELLEFVGLSDKARAYPDQLSGGQKQRVGIARALATNPKILLADECTSALDPDTTREVLDLLREINKKFGVTVIVITHEMDIVKYMCGRVAVMEDGRVAEMGPVYDIFTRPKQAVTRRFVKSSMRDIPHPETVVRLAKTNPGRLLAIEISDETGSTRHINELLAQHGVEGRTVYGGIREIAGRPFGTLTMSLRGSTEATDAVIAGLKQQTPVEEFDLETGLAL